MLKASLLAVLLSTAAGTAFAQDRWQGADELPTNPLGCDGAAGAAAAKPYDGGQPTGAADLNGKPITVVDVPKLVGIGYFNATTQGMQEAAKELGNVTVTDRRADRGEHRRADHLSSTTTSRRASTASCSPPTIRSPSPRC
jgi:ABC-type sugar transport system substrate-binding protein